MNRVDELKAMAKMTNRTVLPELSTIRGYADWAKHSVTKELLTGVARARKGPRGRR